MPRTALASVALGLTFSLLAAPAFADQYYDAGIKLFQQKKYADALRYFEQSIKAAPWESNTYYYCALAYHYRGDFKKAGERYAECVEKFPGTQACTQALAALKVVDPTYEKRKQAAITAALMNADGGSKSGGSASASSSQDKGTIEGAEQARVFFRKNGSDNVVDVRINGRNTRAIFDQNGDSTSFSKQQLAALAITPEKGVSEMRVELCIGGITRKNFPIKVDDSGSAARIGTSYLDAFTVNVDEAHKTIDLKRKSANAGALASLPFSRDGKDILVNVLVNGRACQMLFDPQSSGVQFTVPQAKSAGLKVDDAEVKTQAPGEGPMRGEAGWVPPEERSPGPKLTSIRMKAGPVESPNVSCQISEQGAKYPKFGADLFTSGGYNYELDYRSNRITFSRK
ncbi:MAG: hypothetical protein K2X27_08380 [Candidatus Obscuribacterales bacterium]|nr:hypothetical protein [Candidatus Obscuribacterales bacterium]